MLCEDLDVSFERRGSLFLAFHEGGKDHLKKIWDKGTANGVPDMRMVERDEILSMEPMISPKVIRALYAPTTGIISPFELVVALAESAVQNGVEYLFDTQVLSLEESAEHYLLHTNHQDIRARYIVNTAGGFAGPIEAFVRPADLIIKPKRGQYYILNKEAGKWISHVIYQAAEDDEGGTLMTPTVDGNLLVGPTAEDVPDFTHVETTKEGLAHVEKVARKILPDFDLSKVLTNFAGLRANITNVEKEQKDFIIRASAARFVSALGIKNPGMTCSPALALMIAGLLQKKVWYWRKSGISFRNGKGSNDFSSSRRRSRNGCLRKIRPRERSYAAVRGSRKAISFAR